MKLRIKKFISNTGFGEVLGHFKNYFSSEIALKAISFVSIPVMTRLLTPAEYGVLNLFSSYLGVLTVLLTLNVYVAVGRYFYETTDNFRAFFGTVLLLATVITTFSSIILIFFSRQLTVWLNLPPYLIYFFIPLIIFSVINSLFIQIYQPLKKSRLISNVNVATAVLTFGLSVLFITHINHNKYMGSMYAFVLVGLFSSVYLLFKLKSYINFRFNYGSAKYILGYALPLIPYALSSLILVQFDRIMINSYEGSASVGLYSFAYNIGMLLAVFHSALNSAWIPYYYQYMNEKNYVRHDKDIGLILKLVVVAAVFLSFFGKEIGIVISARSFHSSLNIVPVIVLSYFFLAVYYVYARNFEYNKKTVISSAVVLVSGVANILLNMYAFPRYGYKAAAYTTLIAYIIMAVIAWGVSKFYLRSYSMPLVRLLKSTWLIIPYIASFYVINSLSLTIVNELIVKIVLFASLIFLIYRDIRSASLMSSKA